jgi:hypothetical protein
MIDPPSTSHLEEVTPPSVTIENVLKNATYPERKKEVFGDAMVETINDTKQPYTTPSQE